MMNAGTDFCHEEFIRAGPVEMLQIFIRLRTPDLAPEAAF
jgi:hypothetical protein